jgi:hypothetical protein
MSSQQHPRLAESAQYKVRIHGSIHPLRLSTLCGTWKLATTRVNDTTESVLTGCVIDQAELLGLLNQLYSYGLPLVGLEYLGSGSEESAAQ